MISGVSVIHRGPWVPARTLSNRPELHQSAMVETFTCSSSAAARAE